MGPSTFPAGPQRSGDAPAAEVGTERTRAHGLSVRPLSSDWLTLHVREGHRPLQRRDDTNVVWCSPPADILCSDRPTTGRARRRPEEKRARLLAAARTIFGETGYGASVHEICQAAGVGIGTFYLQFPDKSDLMRF